MDSGLSEHFFRLWDDTCFYSSYDADDPQVTEIGYWKRLEQKKSKAV
jgi:hypothetical protein